MPEDPRIVRSIEQRPQRATGWQARLALGFARQDERTALVKRTHHGPLVVQKALYPEGADVCQVAVVHPPGGIAGGDTLAIDVAVAPTAHAQLVTPGAAKWYRSSGEPAVQTLGFTVEDDGVFEWLPHESILFDGALSRMSTRLSLRGSARAIVWDLICLGRTAAGERFEHGGLHQRVEVVRDDALLWVEQNAITAGASMHASRAGLGGRCAFATFLAAAPHIEDAWLLAARARGSELALDECAVTRVPGLLIGRARSASTAKLHTWLRDLWQTLRPLMLQRATCAPRLWMT